jgi:hypothetical protein
MAIFNSFLYVYQRAKYVKIKSLDTSEGFHNTQVAGPKILQLDESHSGHVHQKDTCASAYMHKKQVSMIYTFTYTYVII